MRSLRGVLPGPFLSVRGAVEVSGLLDLSLIELRKALLRAEVLVEDVVQASVERARLCQPALNAFTEIVEEAPGVPPPSGPLWGIPVAVKDMFVDNDRIPTAGSQVGGHWLRGTAVILQRLRAAGAVVIGYTNLHEWGVDCTSVVTATGPIRNPWDLERIAGGSSGGSAASLASGTVPAAIGSDTGGSIRIPSACCGVVGLKPTWGSVPLDGFVDANSPIDHAGPMARTVTDVRAVFEVLADRTCEVVEVGSLRIGIPSGYFFDGLDPSVAAAMSQGIDVLTQLVRSVGEIDLPGLQDSTSGVASIFVPLTYELLKDDLTQTPEAFQDDTRRLLMAAAQMSSGDRSRGESMRQSAVAAWDTAFSEVDVIVTPTLSKLPPLISECRETLKLGTSAPTVSYLALNAPMNLAGVPSLSLPCGLSGDWTVSMTMSAARGRDDDVLFLGEAFERAVDHRYANRIAPLQNITKG
jgi:aspartyl-tRNA(Asn)/glutamyl-tRNA(Gln) amidotransferase subunit A